MTDSGPFFITLNRSIMAETPKDFVALARAQPELHYGSSGDGGTPHANHSRGVVMLKTRNAIAGVGRTSHWPRPPSVS